MDRHMARDKTSEAQRCDLRWVCGEATGDIRLQKSVSCVPVPQHMTGGRWALWIIAAFFKESGQIRISFQLLYLLKYFGMVTTEQKEVEAC